MDARKVRKHLTAYKEGGLKCPCSKCGGGFVRSINTVISHLCHYPVPMSDIDVGSHDRESDSDGSNDREGQGSNLNDESVCRYEK